VAFTVRGHSTDDVARHLVSHGIYASSGDFYAQTVAERLERGADGFVRAGAACYTTAEEVDRLIVGVKEITTRR
jgi:selenocysteine lyase/cysteine desulfurase